MNRNWWLLDLKLTKITTGNSINLKVIYGAITLHSTFLYIRRNEYIIIDLLVAIRQFSHHQIIVAFGKVSNRIPPRQHLALIHNTVVHKTWGNHRRLLETLGLHPHHLHLLTHFVPTMARMAVKTITLPTTIRWGGGRDTYASSINRGMHKWQLIHWIVQLKTAELLNYSILFPTKNNSRKTEKKRKPFPQKNMPNSYCAPFVESTATWCYLEEIHTPRKKQLHRFNVTNSKGLRFWHKI